MSEATKNTDCRDYTISEIRNIAKVCHQANKAHCEAQGDNSQKDWEQAEEWQRDSAVKGVAFALQNPGASESAQHEAWSDEKLKTGWQFGETKDPVAKTHPCLVPFEKLPKHQQQKDILFKAIVKSLS